MKWLASLMLFLEMSSSALAQTTRPTTQPADAQATLDKKFEQTLSNATMIGSFTTDGRGAQQLKEDRYTLGQVRKLAGDTWVIPAKIGRGDLTIPLLIPVKWAGDTPVISVTDFGIPGMGSYTARVVIHADHYAGTWSAGPDHGGMLFGRIERAPATQPVQPAQQ